MLRFASESRIRVMSRGERHGAHAFAVIGPGLYLLGVIVISARPRNQT